MKIEHDGKTYIGQPQEEEDMTCEGCAFEAIDCMKVPCTPVTLGQHVIWIEQVPR